MLENQILEIFEETKMLTFADLRYHLTKKYVDVESTDILRSTLNQLVNEGRLKVFRICYNKIYYPPNIDFQLMTKRISLEINQMIKERCCVPAFVVAKHVQLKNKISSGVVYDICRSLIREGCFCLDYMITRNSKRIPFYYSKEMEEALELIESEIFDIIKKIKRGCTRDFSRKIKASFSGGTLLTLSMILLHLVYRGELGLVTDGFNKVFFEPGNKVYAEEYLKDFRRFSRLEYYKDELNEICNELSVPEAVLDQSYLLLKKAIRRGIVRGRSGSEVSLACLYTSILVNDIPITPDELANVTGISRNSILRNSKLIRKELKIRVDYFSRGTELFIRKILEELVRNNAIDQKEAKKIYEFSKQFILSIPKRYRLGRRPSSLASAAIYLASRMLEIPLTQKDICDVAGVTEVTLRNILRSWREKGFVTYQQSW